MKHHLKTWPEFFRALQSGAKTFEIRRDDRGFKVDDVLVLEEWKPETKAYKGAYTGAFLLRKVTYLTTWEQKPGFVVMAITP